MKFKKCVIMSFLNSESVRHQPSIGQNLERKCSSLVTDAATPTPSPRVSFHREPCRTALVERLGKGLQDVYF
jgi:hypothetical protein